MEFVGPMLDTTPCVEASDTPIDCFGMITVTSENPGTGSLSSSFEDQPPNAKPDLIVGSRCYGGFLGRLPSYAVG